MKKTLFLLLSALLTVAGTSHAHDLEPLHVDGRYLKNPQGDIVTLHGLMMAVNAFWCEEGNYWTGDDYEGAVKYEKQWVDSLLALDWTIDYIRILVCNEWITDKATGEYNLGALKENGYFEKLYIPIIEHLNSKGIYAVLYYDGIRPEDDLWRIGDKSQQYAIEFWDYISSQPFVKNNPGVMMELYNEPITIVGSDGRQNNFKDVKNYFQPMVDVIRRNGCNNVVWIPGMISQSRYAGYATNPIEGDNIGYAFHAYFIGNSWDNEITPISNMAPCMITEMGWENVNDDEDETSTFGIALKHDIDRMGNVSWNPIVAGQGVYLKVNQPSPDGSLTVYNDPEAFMVPTWNWYKEYADTKTMPTSQLKAVSVEMEDAPTSAFPGESRAMRLMAKFADGRSWNVAGDAVWTSSDESVLSIDRGNILVKKAGQTTIHGTYTDGTGQTFEVQFDVVSSMFPLTAAGVNYCNLLFPSPFDEETRTFTGVGSGGWWWADGIDLSAYRYLVIRLDEAPFYPMTFGLADAKGNELSIEIRFQSEGVIDLQQPGEDIDLSCIKEVQVHTVFPPTAPIKEIFLSNDGVTPAEPPTVRTRVYADCKSMTYGDEAPELTYSVLGTAPSQAPALSTTATKTSPVGTYEITIAGSNDDVDYQPGTLQVLPAPLTITAADIVIGAGMDIPELTLTYEGFRNGDTEDSALSEKPTVTTTATKDSPCGNYEISVSGGSAANYDMVYYGGTLTITPDLTIALPADRTYRVGTSQDDWRAWGECSTEYAPAVTTADGRKAQMVECYEETVGTIGTVMEQTVTGLEDGDYTLVLCANAYYTDGRGFASDLKEGVTDVVCLHANDVTIPMTAHIGTATAKNDEYTLEVTVTAGTLHISMEKLKAGTNWHTLQIKSLTLTRQISFEEAYAHALAEAEELLPQKMTVYEKKDLQQAIVEEHTYANLYRLAAAIGQARKSIEAMRFAKRAIAVMKNEMLTATNVCTSEAEKKFQQFYLLSERLYEDDWLTIERVYDFYNPYEGGGGSGYREIAELLSSAWEIAGVEEPPYGVPWEFALDDGIAPPYVSYNAPEGNTTLEARTLTATMTDMASGEYTLTAFVRLYAADGNVAPKGVTLQLCDGEAVPLSGECFRYWNNYLGRYTARGTVGSDGVLTVRFIVAEDNNVSQLAFRDLWLDDGSAVTANDLTMTYGDAVPELTYQASGDLAGGAPELSTTATSTSPVGTYPITVKPGTVGNKFVRYTDGTLTITKAPLTVGVEDAVITEGDALPAFTLTYDGFRCGDTEATAFTTKPTATTKATASSAPGEYPITVSGGEATNYELTYTGGTLTIEGRPLPQDEDLTARVGTSQEDWHAWGVCATDYAPAITSSDGRTAQMMETYEETVETMGEMMYQDVSGLEPGDYAVEFYANAQYTDGRGFASDLRDGATDVAYVSANDRRCYIAAHVGTAVSENGIYTVYAHVTDGTLHLGLTAEKAGTNWHTLQIKKLTLLRQGTVVYADDMTREQGSTNPQLTYTVSGAEVTGSPRLSCAATTTSEPGTYPIRVAKGTLKSDQPIYLQDGVLTVTVPSAIEAIGSGNDEALPLYDLQGRRVEGRPRPGIYIRQGKVISIRK